MNSRQTPAFADVDWRTARIAFLLYDDRSGSTLLASLLHRNSKCMVTLESNVFLNILRAEAPGTSQAKLTCILDAIYDDPKFVAWGIPRPQLVATLAPKRTVSLQDIAKAILHLSISSEAPRPAVVVVKQGHASRTRGLLSLWSDAKFISLVRDGRAVFASKRRSLHSIRRTPMASDAITAARIWRRAVVQPRHALTPEQLLELKYEALVSHPENELTRICDFLGLPADIEHMLIAREGPTYLSRMPPSQLHLHRNVSQPLLTNRLSAWRTELSDAEVFLFQRIARRELIAMGYPLLDVRWPQDLRAWTLWLSVCARSCFHLGRHTFHWLSLICHDLRARPSGTVKRLVRRIRPGYH